MKILCVGSASYDITIPVSDFPKENTKTRVEEKYECGGGPAATAAYLLAKWNMDVSFIGTIGNDEYGRKLIKEFEQANVNLKNLFIENEETTSSFITINTSNGTRTILTYRPKYKEIENIDLNFKPDVILTDGQEYKLMLNLMEKYPDAVTIIDAGRYTENIVELSKKVDYVVCSKDFAEKATNIDSASLKKMYNKLKEIFNTNIIVTLESKGCLYEIDGNIKIMPAIKVDAVDSTGAGDIFHGAFTYGVANNLDLESILKISNIAAGLSVTKIGSRNSVMPLEEVMRIYDGTKRNIL